MPRTHKSVGQLSEESETVFFFLEVLQKKEHCVARIPFMISARFPKEIPPEITEDECIAVCIYLEFSPRFFPETL